MNETFSGGQYIGRGRKVEGIVKNGLLGNLSILP